MYLFSWTKFLPTILQPDEPVVEDDDDDDDDEEDDDKDDDDAEGMCIFKQVTKYEDPHINS